MNRKELIIKHIKDRIASLEELGKVYSEEKIESLAENLANSDKTLTEINTLIDNKFSNQIRKINHNNYLASLKEYYLSKIEKLKKGNNCYLLSYDQGVKILEQAYLEELQDITPYLKLVNVNNDKKGYKKENSVNNDYELIMSDIAYLLNIDYAHTYRIFDEQMNPNGIVNVSFVRKNERFLNFEEALRFIKEESPKFTLTQKLLEYHDKHIKHGLKEAKKDDYKNNIEYVFDLFSALPDIKEENIEKLKTDYLNMKIFEILTNSLNNNLNNIGLMVNKESLNYTYRLSPSYNKCSVEIPTLKYNQTICNFFIVDKKELLSFIINNYYNNVKELLSLIYFNKDSLLTIINQVLKEHLEFNEYSKYHKLINENINMICELVSTKKQLTPDTKDDMLIYEDNNLLYKNRVSPVANNYVSDEYEEEKGSTILLAIVTIVLFITIGIILLAIYSVSKMNM